MNRGPFISHGAIQTRQRLAICFAAFAVLLLLPLVSWASPIVVFGDSLSDVGNAYHATGGKFPPVPYKAGRFSNGPLWVEQFARTLNSRLPTPSSLGGSDFAYAGAATGATPLGTQLHTPAGFSPFTTPQGQFIANVPSLPTQIANYLATLKGGQAAPGTLVTMWAGANDFFDGQRNPTVPAKNIANAISTLIAAGVKNFLIANLPDLSKTPFGLASPVATQQGLHALALGYNQALRTDLRPFANMPGVHVHTLDTYSLFQQIQANPAQFKLTNVTGEGILSGNPAAPGYLFWDDVHPTTAGQHIIARAAAAAATPEPGSASLMVSGLFGFLSFGWRRRKNQARKSPVRDKTQETTRSEAAKPTIEEKPWFAESFLLRL